MQSQRKRRQRKRSAKVNRKPPDEGREVFCFRPLEGGRAAAAGMLALSMAPSNGGTCVGAPWQRLSPGFGPCTLGGGVLSLTPQAVVCSPVKTSQLSQTMRRRRVFAIRRPLPRLLLTLLPDLLPPAPRWRGRSPQRLLNINDSFDRALRNVSGGCDRLGPTQAPLGKSCARTHQRFEIVISLPTACVACMSCGPKKVGARRSCWRASCIGLGILTRSN